MRASFPAAIAWLALNDDCSWVYESDWTPPVSALLVADLFGKSIEHVRAQIERYCAKERITAHAR